MSDNQLTPFLLEQSDGSRKYGEFYLATATESYLPYGLSLFFLVVLLLSGWALLYYLRIRQQRYSYRKQALAQLHHVYQQYQQHQHDPDQLSCFLQQTQQLLKQVAVTVYAGDHAASSAQNPVSARPYLSVAALSGDNWHNFLLQQLGQTTRKKHHTLCQDVRPYFSLCYQPVTTKNRPHQNGIAIQFYRFAVLWIRKHRVSITRVSVTNI